MSSEGNGCGVSQYLLDVCMYLQLFGDVFHERSRGPWLLEKVVQRVNLQTKQQNTSLVTLKASSLEHDGQREMNTAQANKGTKFASRKSLFFCRKLLRYDDRKVGQHILLTPRATEKE